MWEQGSQDEECLDMSELRVEECLAQRVLQAAGEGGPGEVIKQVAPVALPSPGLVVDLGEVQVDDIVPGGEGDAFIQPPVELLHGSRGSGADCLHNCGSGPVL